MAMADAEHNSVKRRSALLTEGETDETDAARNPRPKPLNIDATTTPTPYLDYLVIPGRLFRDRS
jgi:hypothetical protein